jgi:hypothetical protein
MPKRKSLFHYFQIRNIMKQDTLINIQMTILQAGKTEVSHHDQ